jgi:hypothetical protein
MILVVKGVQVRSDIWVVILFDQGDRLAGAVAADARSGRRLERVRIETVGGGDLGWGVAADERLSVGREQTVIVKSITVWNSTSGLPAFAHK